MARLDDAEPTSASNTSECPPSEGSSSSHPLLVRVEEAAAITGLPASLIRKSFIDERKRPANIPPPPPHKRVGRSVYIIRDQLAGWVDRLGEKPMETVDERPRRGRPTVGERRARQAANDNAADDNTEISPSPAIERAARKPRR